jgi:glycosidase
MPIPKNTLNRRQAGLLVAGSMATPAAFATEPASTGPRHVPWSRNASIYEVNIRQFTPEGTLRAFEAQLPRIAKLGVGIVWLMPLQPIGIKNRKGSLGSYYSIRDYTAVNPEFGTLGDLQRVVARAHALGMKVILDWVANHTAWDHPWITQHPDWYVKDAKGEIGPFSHVWTPGQPPDVWEDVVGLDYGNKALWPVMIDAMRFWMRETGLDGFRCDVAGLVPTPFWEAARAALDRIKPVFMLAESDNADLHDKAFDMTYDWGLYDALKKIAQGKADTAAIREWWAKRQKKFSSDAYGMNFTGNHDTNSWDGTDAEFYGSRAAFKAMAVAAATLPGMPLVYGGQESFFENRLKFFEKDPINWTNYEMAGLYAELLALKRRTPAMANGNAGGSLNFIETGSPTVLAFSRQRGASQLTVAINMSARPQNFSMAGGAQQTLAAWAWTIAAH